jgi:hypothetical protein
MSVLSEELLNVVKECGEHQRRGCNQEYCLDCKWNLYQYVDISPGEYALLMRYGERQAHEHSRSKKVNALLLGLAAIVCILIGKSCYDVEHRAKLRPADTLYVPTSQNAQWVEVKKVLQKTSREYQYIDVNEDGLYNCIDAALLFYQYYQGNCRIALNVNYDTDMNHLFNQVLIAGKWWDVEPQQADGSMNIWGNSYNPSLTRDATEYYSRWVRR